MNRMADVAALFGKKLGEEFTVLRKDYGYTYKAKFTKTSFRVIHPFNDYWSWDDGLLAKLIAGEAVIVDD